MNLLSPPLELATLLPGAAVATTPDGSFGGFFADDVSESAWLRHAVARLSSHTRVLCGRVSQRLTNSPPVGVPVSCTRSSAFREVLEYPVHASSIISAVGGGGSFTYKLLRLMEFSGCAGTCGRCPLQEERNPIMSKGAPRALVGDGLAIVT